MPKSNRDFHKRAVGQAYFDISQAIQRIDPLYQQFLPVHPEIAEILGQCLQAWGLSLIMIDNFVKVSWDIDQPDYDSWRNKSERKEDE